MIYFEEMSRRQIPRSLNPQGLGIIAPSIRDYGTPEQIERFLLPTLRAEIAWCLGISEPAAGSDLASLRTRAVTDGDEFVINGQKVWTSGAHHADWCLCFVRTNTEVPKHQGISVLIVAMDTPGVEPRPVPRAHRTRLHRLQRGVLHRRTRVRAAICWVRSMHGWPITQGSLAHERAMLWIDYAYSLDRATRALVELGPSGVAGGGGSATTRCTATRSPTSAIDTQALLCMGYRGFSKFMAGKSAPEHSLLKLFGSEPCSTRLRSARTALGAPGLDRDPARSADVAGRRVVHAVDAVVRRAPSRAVRARSNATSSPSGCSACPAVGGGVR